MKPLYLIEKIKRQKQIFKVSKTILQTLWQSRDGGWFSKTLAGVSMTGELLDVLYPDQTPYDLVHQYQLVCKRSSISKLIHNLLFESPTGQLMAADDYSRFYGWQENNDIKLGVIVSSFGGFEIYINPKYPEFLANLIRSIAWKDSSELELAKIIGDSQSKNLFLLKMNPPGPYIGKLNPSWFADRISKYPAGARTILFRGPSGVGKGVLARHVSKILKQNSLTLKISAESLQDCSNKELVDLVQILQPTVLLLDDLELDDPKKTSSFLALFESLRDPNCLVIATMMIDNPTEELARGSWHFPGMRPGRIDEIFMLTLPDYEDRFKILCYYVTQLGNIELISQIEILKSLAEKTEGLSGAYLSALIERISVHGIANWERELNYILYSAPPVKTEDTEEEEKKTKKKRSKDEDD